MDFIYADARVPFPDTWYMKISHIFAHNADKLAVKISTG